MKRIGITGGIGSGKSYVCQHLVQLGYRIYEADTRAKALMVTDAELMSGVRALFGAEAYLPDGQLNRALIGQQVFGDAERLQALNRLVHPATARDFRAWVAATPPDYPHQLLFKEAAILYESGADRDADGVITVYAPRSVRLQRAMARDGVSAAQVEARMGRQWPEARRLARADFAIFNDGQHPIPPQVAAAINYFS
ncbi:MAG: dephospho-CoA kinase [Bacteroidetes bacterium]|nr:MAG: dephospho-CoA kinase [Bacteroidota bacterium]